MLDRLKEFIGKYKRLILIIIAILLIAIIVFFSIPRPTKKAPALAPQTSVPGKALVLPAPAAPVEATPQQKSESSVLAAAKSFAEIYGTYSNQSNYANIANVLPLASLRYRQELTSSLNTLRAAYKPGANYEGTTTIVVNKTVDAINDVAGTATVTLQTQRKISQGTQSNYTIKYQSIRFALVKEGDSWFVDSAKWLQ